MPSRGKNVSGWVVAALSIGHPLGTHLTSSRYSLVLTVATVLLRTLRHIHLFTSRWLPYSSKLLAPVEDAPQRLKIGPVEWLFSVEAIPKEHVSQVPTIETTEVVDPVGHVQVIYLGPVAPHWECRMVFGDEEQIQAFVDRVDARLRFLPPHDPQFRRNRERVNRDAERENLLVEWNLGYDEESRA